jgi:hypothetical protein
MFLFVSTVEFVVLGKGVADENRFDAGLYGMCPEERRWLKIKPEFGYGAKGVPGVIPPNATLSMCLFYHVLLLPTCVLLPREQHLGSGGRPFYCGRAGLG